MLGLEAAERSAASLAEAAEHLVGAGVERSSAAALDARARLADASEALAGALRPAPRRRRPARLLLLVIAAAGLGVLAYRSPLGGRLRRRLSPRVEPEPPESITLPATRRAETEMTGAHDGGASGEPSGSDGAGILVAAGPEPGPSEPGAAGSAAAGDEGTAAP